MEGSTKSNKNLILAAAAVILILVIAAGGFFVLKNKENLPIENLESENDSSQRTQQVIPTSASNSNNSMMMNKGGMMVSYKDGTYSATGSYFTPGGTEQIGVTIILRSGVIASSEVAQEGKSPTAKIKQADFAENFKPFVVGKNIDKVNLTVVSGSSLTTQGFDDALSQIKSQAKF